MALGGERKGPLDSHESLFPMCQWSIDYDRLELGKIHLRSPGTEKVAAVDLVNISSQ